MSSKPLLIIEKVVVDTHDGGERLETVPIISKEFVDYSKLLAELSSLGSLSDTMIGILTFIYSSGLSTHSLLKESDTSIIDFSVHFNHNGEEAILNLRW